MRFDSRYHCAVWSGCCRMHFQRTIPIQKASEIEVKEMALRHAPGCPAPGGSRLALLPRRLLGLVLSRSLSFIALRPLPAAASGCRALWLRRLLLLFLRLRGLAAAAAAAVDQIELR